MDTPQTELVIRDWPIGLWAIGLIFFLVTAFTLNPTALMRGDMTQVLTAVAGILGLALLLLPAVITITADRARQSLSLRSRSAFKASEREIPFSQIASIQLEMSHGSRRHDSDSGPSYRIVFVTTTGDVIPLRTSYSSGTAGKSRKIKRLREFIGVGGSDMGMGLAGTLREASKMVQAEFQKQQETQTGPAAETHVTGGIHWQVQTVTMGASPLTRWYSPDFRVPEGFIYISQILEGQNMGGGLLGAVSGLLFKQAMSMYGFAGADTPGVETARVLPDPDPQIARAFSVYTSVPDRARAILNPRVAASLADWNRRYPLQRVQDRPIFTQLAVMFSPQGAYVCSLGTMIPEAVEEMTRLGVELLNAQTSTPETTYPTKR